MIIHPQIQGCVARNCHPIGCRAAVLQQISSVKAAGSFNGPRRVLVLGASSGFGLASRIALTFGAGADSVGVSFERGPSDKGLGSAGWYNNIWFRQAAEQEGRVAVNLIGDAFSDAMRQQAIDTIRQQLGQVDLVISGLKLDALRTPESVAALIDELRYELESNSLRSSRDTDLA